MFINFKIFLDEFSDHEVVKTWPKPVLSQNGTRFKSGYFPNTQETEISIAPKTRVKRAVSLYLWFIHSTYDIIYENELIR